MKLNKAERAALILAAVFLALLAGYHFGIGSTDSGFTISTENKYTRTDKTAYQTTISGASQDDEPSQGNEASGGKININTAGADALRSLPGIGETLANRVIAYRDENGPFTSLDDIMNVSGIGEAKFSAISGIITLTD